jgi:putative heme iron utilization protein
MVPTQPASTSIFLLNMNATERGEGGGERVEMLLRAKELVEEEEEEEKRLVFHSVSHHCQAPGCTL